MQASDWIALGALTVSGVAAVFAGLSWRASDKSAKAAIRSAGAADRSADAAESGARTAQDALDHEIEESKKQQHVEHLNTIEKIHADVKNHVFSSTHGTIYGPIGTNYLKQQLQLAISNLPKNYRRMLFDRCLIDPFMGADKSTLTKDFEQDGLI